MSELVGPEAVIYLATTRKSSSFILSFSASGNHFRIRISLVNDDSSCVYIGAATCTFNERKKTSTTTVVPLLSQLKMYLINNKKKELFIREN